MTVNWNGYEPYVPTFTGPLHELTRGQAVAEYEHLMRSKADRLEQLRALLQANGIELRNDDASIQELNDWLRANVETSTEDPTRLQNLWYAVVNDVALFLGDVIIERNPSVRWQMFTAGKTDASFQRHTLTGFTNVANPKYNIDVDTLVATYAYRAARGHTVPSDQFASVVHAAADAA